MSPLVLHLFGSPRMDLDGAPVDVDTRKATALLAYLAVTGDIHQRDTLAALLWPDYDQTSARAALRRTLSTLNRALEGATSGASGGSSGGKFLEITRESIGLAAGADIWLDVSEFHRLVGSLAAHGHTAGEICLACLEALAQAAALYHEPFMAGFNLRDSPNFEEWQFFQEETMRRERSNVLEKLAFGLSAAGRENEAIDYARSWLALDPLSEEAHRQLMLLYMQAGQRNAALRQYRECVRILDQELGVAPLEETTKLYQAILNRQQPAAEERLRFLADAPAQAAMEAAARPVHPPRSAAVQGGLPPPSRSAAVPATLAGTPSRSAAETTPQAGMPSQPLASPEVDNAPARPFVGRDAELAQLRKAFQTSQVDGRFITFEGEAGIGKTRLAETFLNEARVTGSRVVQARCYSGEAGLAYAPFLLALNAALSQPGTAARLKSLPAGTLAEASRLLPELSGLVQRSGETSSTFSPENDGGQVRFFEALRQVLRVLLSGEKGAGTAPGILFLDDLHWADAASLDLLTYLARRLKGIGLLLLVAWRDEPGETAQCLERLALELARSGQALRLQLKRLEPRDVVELVCTFPGAEPFAGQAETIGQQLYQESEGLPFVAVEYLAVQVQRMEERLLDAAQGLAKAGSGPGTLIWEMPGSVRELLRSRLENLDATAQQLLSTAAVIGRSFDFNTLREVSGRSEVETVDGLERLLAAGQVTEQNSQERSPAEIRYDFTYEKLRALIYDETSLARRRLLHRRIAETLAHLPGSRPENAGLVAYHYEQAGLVAQAAEYHLHAGEQARRLFANTEALAHFQAALAAGYPDAALLHEAIGDLRVLRGEYGAALTSYQTAAALCTPGCLANLEHKLGSVHQRLGSGDLAESHYQASLEALSEMPETAFHVHLFADRALAAHTRGDLAAAQAFAARALELAQSVGDAHALAQAYNALGVLARARGEQQTAIRSLEASLRIAETLDDPLARIAALNNLALVYGENKALDEAIRLTILALELCQKRGDRHREAALHNNLADLLHRAGREEEAMAQLKQAVVIFTDIGAPESGTQPEIWKLTEW